MKTTFRQLRTLGLAGLLLLPALPLRGQGTFVNLNFELASLQPIPSGQYGGLVPFSNALPGWVGYLGTNQTAQALQNIQRLNSAAIGVVGPNWVTPSSGIGVIEGRYTAVLQAGDAIVTGNYVPAAIAQSGLIPPATSSIQMKVSPVLPFSALFGVSLGGQNVPLFPLSGTSAYTRYGGDISAYAGQVVELRVTAFNTLPGIGLAIDSIQFSPEVIPEPSNLRLFGVGALLLGWRRFRKRP